jgi:hypothetical protein
MKNTNNTISAKSVTKSTETRRKNKIAKHDWASYGSIYMGGICPVIAMAVAHCQAPDLTKVKSWDSIPTSAFLWIIVIGLLCYSAPLIAEWFSKYVGNFKAWGFCVAMETTLTFTNWTTSLPALLTLIALNAMILRNKFLTVK